MEAEDINDARKAARAFVADYGARWPKATLKIADDLDVLLEFYNYPAQRWIRMRTTNPIESTHPTVRLRQRVTKAADPGTRGWQWGSNSSRGLSCWWKAIRAPHLVALVRAGASPPVS